MQTASGGGATSSGGSCTAGTATAADALAGVTFPDGAGGMTTGTMTNVGAFNLTGAFSAGYVSSLTGLAASSVCSTTSLLGSAGTATCVTGAPDAVVGNVLTGKTFWNAAGAVVTGTMANNGSANLSTTSPSAAGYYSGFTNGTPTNTTICNGTTILSTAGSAICVTGTPDAVLADVASGKTFWNAAGAVVTGTGTVVTGTPDATVGNVLSGKTFWNAAGAPVTGTMTNQGSWSLSGASAVAAPAFPGAGYYSGITNAPATTNYCAGTYINGSNGTAVCAGGATTGTTIAAGQVCSGYSGYNLAGTAINGSKTCADVGTPSALSNLQLWFKANAIAGLSTGANMTVWRDQSSNQYDGYTASPYPTYVTNVVNSLPVVRPTGTTSRLNIYNRSSLSITGDITIIVALNPSQNGDDNTYHTILAKRNAGSTNDCSFEIALQNAAGTGSANGTNPGLSGALAWFSTKSGGTYSLLNSTSTISKNAWHILVVVVSGTSVSFFDNGTAIGTDTILANSRPTVATSENVVLFQASETTSSEPYQGDMGEVLIYSSALNSTDRASVECYLSSKFNISIGHGC